MGSRGGFWFPFAHSELRERALSPPSGLKEHSKLGSIGIHCSIYNNPPSYRNTTHEL
jgi:hypothetical protein